MKRALITGITGQDGSYIVSVQHKRQKKHLSSIPIVGGLSLWLLEASPLLAYEVIRGVEEFSRRQSKWASLNLSQM